LRTPEGEREYTQVDDGLLSQIEAAHAPKGLTSREQ
jgi:hypothetical protein